MSNLISLLLKVPLSPFLFAMKHFYTLLANKTTTFAKALKEGTMSEEILIRNEENLLICGNGIFACEEIKNTNKNEEIHKMQSLMQQSQSIMGGGR